MISHRTRQEEDMNTHIAWPALVGGVVGPRLVSGGLCVILVSLRLHLNSHLEEMSLLMLDLSMCLIPLLRKFGLSMLRVVTVHMEVKGLRKKNESSAKLPSLLFPDPRNKID